MVKLRPTEPPGNSKRKLRAFASEISRLRSEGYTIRAIRQALAGAGVEVGWSTVHREVARLGKPLAAARPPLKTSEAPARPERPPPVKAVPSPPASSAAAKKPSTETRAKADATDASGPVRLSKAEIDEIFDKPRLDPRIERLLSKRKHT